METYFSTDMLAEILRRLPPSARRRARLVCRLWRDVVGEHTTEMKSRVKPLHWNTRSAVAYVMDDLSPSSTGSCTELWRGATNQKLVDTCNGLLCLCDNSCGSRAGGDITLVNPTTRETLAIPPVPCTEQFVGHRRETMRWDKAYGFAYHPTSGRYKVVHVPCSFDLGCSFDSVYVLKLGKEAIWRKVPAPRRARRKCNLNAGIVSVDGVTYWVADGGTARVVSFHLGDERITCSTTPLLARSHDYNLTGVRGRLGLVVRNRAGARDAWVLEEGAWTLRFSVACPSQDIPRPNFAFGEYASGEYFLTRDGSELYGHQTRGTSSSAGRSCRWTLLCDVLKVDHRNQGTLVAKITGDGTYYCRYDYYETFAYVSTLEPLGVYSTKSC